VSITHDGFTFGHKAGVMQFGPVAVPIQIDRFPGLKGESIITGQPYGREFWCSYTLDGLTHSELLEALLDIDRNAGQLTGTVTVTGNDAQAIDDAVFVGFERNGPYFVDGSGVNGWVQRGRLRWIQQTF